jgi:predicted enzyme related to lactoylglutathione lyase
MTARHCLQAIWKVGVAGMQQQQLVVNGLAGRFGECSAEKNCTLIHYDIIRGLKQLYAAVQDEQVKMKTLELQVANEPGSTTWYELYTPNAKQARDFYIAFLGATADPMPSGLEYYVLRHAEEDLGGITQIDPAWGAMPAQWVNYFTVANADETVATVIEHGGKQMGSIDDSPFGRIAALMDPFGATFKVLQPPGG